MNYKLVGIDLDGTLLNSQHEVDQDTIEAIRECKKKGIKIVLATGRLYRSIRKYIELLELENEQITLNGAAIINSADHSVFREKLLPAEYYRQVIRNGKKRRIPVMVFDSTSYYSEKHHAAIKEMEIMCNLNVKVIPDIESIKNVSKVLFITHDNMTIESIKKVVDHEKLNCIRTGYDYIEVFDRTVNKGTAIRAIAEEYGIDAKEVLAIGDSDNDMEMIRYAGMGIAMGNAYEEIKDVSDAVTDTNNRSGVAKALYHYVL